MKTYLQCPRCGEKKQLFESTGNCLTCRNDEIALAESDLTDTLGTEESVYAAKWLKKMFDTIKRLKEPPYE